MPQWKKNLVVLWVGGFVSAMCFTIMSPFLPLFLKQLDVQKGLEMWAGVCVSASFFMNALMSPIWGSLADRYGRKIMVIRSGIAQAVVYSLQYFVTSPWQFLALRILNGAFSGMNPACASLAATETPEEHVGYALGVLQTASATGTIMGPLFGGFAANYLGYRVTFLGSGILLCAVTAWIIVAVRESTPRGVGAGVHVWRDLREAFQNPLLRTVFITAIVVQAALSLLQPILSLQIDRLGGGENSSIAAGVIYSLAGVAAVIAAPYWAKVGSQHGYRSILLFGLAGAGLLHIPMAFATSMILFGALRFATGLATAGANLSVSALAAQSVDPAFRGRAFGILASCNQFGQFLGPLVGGVSGSTLGLSATFNVTATALLATACMVWRLMPRQKPKTATM